MASLVPWIEKDAVESLQHGEIEQLGPTVAKITSLCPGWTAAGINLTFGRTTTNPYPSMTITDGKHEVVAYLITETAQSSAFSASPPLTNGSRIRLEGCQFAPEPVGTGDAVSTNATPGVTFALTVRGEIEVEPAPPIINLNYSKTFSRAVGDWMVRKMDGAGGPLPSTIANLPVPTDGPLRKRSLSQASNDDTISEASNPPPKKGRRKSQTTKKKTTKKRVVLSFEEKFEALKEYEEEHGHCNVPVSHKHEKFGLGVWCNYLRVHRDSFTKAQQSQLDDLGFIWDLTESKWNKNFEALERYIEEYDSSAVPIGYKDDDGINLGTWVYTQRQNYNKGILKPERKKKLDEVDFDFSPRRARNSLDVC